MLKNLKKFRHILKRHVYGLSSSFRVLPDFIIIGAMKSGTTSLYYDICQHPSIYPAAYDEIGFFDVNYHLGLNWYRSFFPLHYKKKKIIKKTNYFLTGEDTPFYFWREDAAKRIKKVLPNIKLIVILRNPIDRAYSNYIDGIIRGIYKETFEKHVLDEIQRIKNEQSYILSEENFSRYTRNLSNIAKGHYAEQLELWIRHFPKEQICVISTQDLSSNPQNTLSQIFNFLSLPDHIMKDFHRKKEKKYTPMNQDIRNTLIEYYQPLNLKLYNLIGKRFDWDK